MQVIPEIDGVRLLTSSRMDLLRRVPSPSAALFAPGATSPGAQLWDAREAFERADPRAERLLRGVSGEGGLGEAVEACALAAGAGAVWGGLSCNQIHHIGL